MIAGADVPVKVSVVVPVWNPGPYIDPCIASLLGQTLPADEFEIILVDDGSTDGTAARLDTLAAEHPTLRVIHIPNSGWPGRPRNIGIEAAHGEYIQFVDQDDQMTPEALERLYAMGARNGSDIVIGKVAGSFRSHAPVGDHAIRGVPQVLFRQNREACTIFDAPLIDSLTPHKMFRSAFLREHGIRFPEGRMRLEDQLFVVPAYFAASVVSVLGDYVCYLYRERDDGGNAGSLRIDPAAYYADLRSVVDIVIANTEPGEVRDRLLRRFFRGEMLGRLSEPSFQRLAPDFRAVMVDAVRDLAADRIPTSVDAMLGSIMGLRASFLRDDRAEALLGLASRLDATEACVTLGQPAWSAGRLAIPFQARFATGADRPLVVAGPDGRYRIDPGITDGLTAAPLDVTDALDSLKAEVILRDRATGAQWPVPTRIRLERTEDGVEGGPPVPPMLIGTATLDPRALAGGRGLDRGVWDFSVRTTGLGLDRSAPLVATASLELGPALLGDPPQLAVPFVDHHGQLALDIDRHGISFAAALAGGPIAPVRDGRSLAMRLPVAASGLTTPAATELVVRRDGFQASLPARLEARSGRLVLLASAGRAIRGARPGRYELAARLDGPTGPETRLGTIRVRRAGRIAFEEPSKLTPAANARWLFSEWAWSAYSRMPERVRRGLRSRARPQR
jgi:glycosyltransferase involved in cell wall biosynthesis